MTKAKLSWREAQKQELKQQLFGTALALFEQQGYDNTNVLQIVAAVGVAKGTFFNHFPNKEAVLAEYMDSVTAAALADAKGHDEATALAAVLYLIGALFRHAMQRPAIFRMACELSQTNRFLRHKDQQLDHAIAEHLATCLAHGQESGEICAEVALDELAAVIIAVLTFGAQEWVASDGKLDFNHKMHQRLSLVFKGVATDRSQVNA